MQVYRLTNYGAEALEDTASSALPGTRDARTVEVGGRLSQAFRDGGLDTQVGTKRAGFKTGVLRMSTPFANKNTPGAFGPKVAPKTPSAKFKPSTTPTRPKAGQKPSQKPLAQQSAGQKPSQKPLAQQGAGQKPSQKPQTAPKGGTGKPQTAYLAETAKLIGMSFSWKDVSYSIGSVAVSGVLYPTVTVTPYTWSGDVRLAGTPVVYDPTSADWSAVAYQALSAFKAYNDDIALRNANAPLQSASTGASADVAVPLGPTTASIESGGGKVTVTSEATGQNYTLVDTSMYTPPAQAEDAVVVRASDTSLAQEAQAVVDEALAPADAVVPEDVTTVSSALSATPSEGFLAKYKWWLVAGSAVAAGYVFLHRSNPSTYPLPAALSKLVR